MSLFLLLTYYISLVVSFNEAARILGVFPTPSISHQVVFRSLTKELAKRGHEVIVITTDPEFKEESRPFNLTEIDVHDISYKIWAEKFMKTSKGNKEDLITQLDVFLDASNLLVDAQLRSDQIQTILRDKNQTFDLILIEACVRPALIFSHIYNAPVILVSSFSAVFDNYATIGAPQHLFLYPAITNQRINKLTIWEKLKELYNNYLIGNLYERKKNSEYQMLKKHVGTNMPSINDLNNNVDMLFLNVHPIFEGIRPVPPTVVYMGGLHQKPEKDLPPNIKSYLDSSSKGVIYISFGTNVDPSMLPPEIIQTFVKVFSKLPYNVLWKWNEDELPGRTDNIKISKWLPQSDLLKHPNIRLFITQGGLQSTDEAITAGVPLIGIPMLGDQWFNVEKYVYHKIGIRLDIDEINAEKLTKAIKSIIDDKSYRHNIIKLRNIMRDEPLRPLERAVWWTEYVLRHGGASHLRAPAANISWAQYLELDLVVTLVLIFLVASVLFLLTLRFVYLYVAKYYVNVKIKHA